MPFARKNRENRSRMSADSSPPSTNRLISPTSSGEGGDKPPVPPEGNRWQTAWRGFRWLSVRILGGYVILVSVITFLQRKLIYFPTQTGRLPAAATGLPPGTVHDISFTTHDGLTLHGWHFLSRGSSAHNRDEIDRHLAEAEYVVLYFHGNGGNRQHRRELCRAFTDNGADVFLFDYRGYAENPGEPSEENLQADAHSLWEYAVRTRHIPPARLVLFGESLGSGLAVPLAAESCQRGEAPGGLMLWGGFSSLVEVGSHHYGWLPVRWLLRDRYESIDKAGDVCCPVLQLHGENDRIVPVELGQRLFLFFPPRAGNGVPKQWITLANRGHNDLSPRQLREALAKFLRMLPR